MMLHSVQTDLNPTENEMAKYIEWDVAIGQILGNGFLQSFSSQTEMFIRR